MRSLNQRAIKGKEEGIVIGKEKGKEEGMAIGKHETSKEIALQLIKEGGLSIKQIARVTKFSEEFLQLLASLQKHEKEPTI